MLAVKTVKFCVKAVTVETWPLVKSDASVIACEMK